MSFLENYCRGFIGTLWRIRTPDPRPKRWQRVHCTLEPVPTISRLILLNAVILLYYFHNNSQQSLNVN